MISVIDYDAGNLRSVEKALCYLGADARITRDRDAILSSNRVVLPGVGSFGDAMEKLRQYGLVNTIYDIVDRRIPLLGICLGLQLLYETSEESPGVGGLGILRGDIVKIPPADGRKIPHMGWNSLRIRQGAKLFRDMPAEPYVYFVHSYYLRAKDQEEVAATAEYGVTIHASVERGRIWACQFHPEKSGAVGLRILENFIND